MQFTPSHEWIVCQNDIGTVGITLYAQKELGEVVYIELPKLGEKIQKGQELAVLESTKAAADIYSPVSGLIVEINQSLMDNCDSINTSPEREGWLCKIMLDDTAELKELMTTDQYQLLVKE
jgi:glycine cleavage system H protein